MEKPSYTVRTLTPPTVKREPPRLVPRTYYYEGATITTGVPVIIHEFVHNHKIVDEDGKVYNLKNGWLAMVEG